LTPANIKTALTAQGTLITQKDTTQENAKTALKTATIQYNNAANTAYNVFTSTVDLLIGAAGKGTPLAKQIQAIRKKLTSTKQSGGGSSSSSSSTSDSSSSSGDELSESSTLVRGVGSRGTAGTATAAALFGRGQLLTNGLNLLASGVPLPAAPMSKSTVEVKTL